MDYQELEKKLASNLMLTRLIFVILSLFFFILGLVTTYFREATKEVVEYDEAILQYTTVKYNNIYLPFMIIGFLFGIVMLGLLISSAVYTGFKTTFKDGYHITLYKGLIKCIVYVDGKEKGRIKMSYKPSMDIILPNNLRMTVTFYQGSGIGHVSFGDNGGSFDV